MHPIDNVQCCNCDTFVPVDECIMTDGHEPYYCTDCHLFMAGSNGLRIASVRDTSLRGLANRHNVMDSTLPVAEPGGEPTRKKVQPPDEPFKTKIQAWLDGRKPKYNQSIENLLNRKGE